MHRSLHKMLLVAGSTALLVGGLVAPVAAQEAQRPATTAVALTDVQPETRPEHGETSILRLDCEGRRSERGDLGAVCRWSTADSARAYQLWRIVDRGDRELVGTYDAGTTAARDDVPDDARLVRYAVLAIDADGDLVGRSRVTRVRFRTS